MSQEAMSGIDFRMSGVVRTANAFYVILIDDESTLYFPVACSPTHALLIDGELSEKMPFEVGTFGIYFSFLSMLKANGVGVTEVAITVGKNNAATCYLDLVQENELGMKVSRIPVMLSDAMVLCALFKVPVVVYGAVGTDFAFSIDKGIPKDNIFSFICDDICKSEKLMSLRQGDE